MSKSQAVSLAATRNLCLITPSYSISDNYYFNSITFLWYRGEHKLLTQLPSYNRKVNANLQTATTDMLYQNNGRRKVHLHASFVSMVSILGHIKSQYITDLTNGLVKGSSVWIQSVKMIYLNIILISSLQLQTVSTFQYRSFTHTTRSKIKLQFITFSTAQQTDKTAWRWIMIRRQYIYVELKQWIRKKKQKLIVLLNCHCVVRKIPR